MPLAAKRSDIAGNFRAGPLWSALFIWLTSPAEIKHWTCRIVDKFYRSRGGELVWNVGAILKEPVPITLRFVAWYLEMGARHITLYFDDPSDPAIGILDGHARVTAIPCTPEFWHSIGAAQDQRFTKRQNAALGHAYRNLESGWLLNVDSDELLYLKDQTVDDMLAGVGENVRGIRVLPAEVIQAPQSDGGTYFRMPMKRWVLRDVYGEDAPKVARRQGLVGHTEGKSFTRAGHKNGWMRQHWMQDRDGNAFTDLVLGPDEGAYLLHFFEEGFESWLAKKDWRLGSRGFKPQMKNELSEIAESYDPKGGYRAIYDILHRFDANRLKILMDAGAGLRLDIDFGACVKTQFPDHG